VRSVALAAAFVIGAGAARAHDFWIEPSTFRPLPGTVVGVSLRVGEQFIGDPVPRNSNAIAAFFVRQNGKDEPIGGADRIDPAGFFRADGRVAAIVGYASTGAAGELPARRFEEYLRQHGLEHVLSERARRGEQNRPGRERFYRYAKALIAGEGPSAAAAQPLGFAYEIVPDDDPEMQRRFRGRVLYNGRPLAGALVVALLRGESALAPTARSDAHGAFAFDLPRPGVWLIKSVHMVRASFFSHADWDSLWASLTFENAERP
jgi:hypothetical protein